ncbi:hypothetical protein [uncultured Clostridium sp.]|uniref:hypothetical protein n=1 Tax=uncultured Clostridium sp. TaxID=59620 RepID=UPI0025DB8C78|nr:hypothetical protein [uncultured Clostridium sp.]
MNIVILSLIETLGICMVGLIFFILFLFIPAEGIKIKKEFKVGPEGFCIRIERIEEKKKE